MIPFDESSHRFQFGTTWSHVERWDASATYAHGIGTVNGSLDGNEEGTKAVDFIGLHESGLWFIEVKDFRNRQIQFKDRVRELPLEIALKARDTIAGLVGARRDPDPENWIVVAVAGMTSAIPLTVVAVIAEPQATRALSEKKLAVHRQVLMDRTRQRLRWLTRRVLVVTPEECALRLPDLEVTGLAQARHP